MLVLVRIELPFACHRHVHRVKARCHLDDTSMSGQHRAWVTVSLGTLVQSTTAQLNSTLSHSSTQHCRGDTAGADQLPRLAVAFAGSLSSAHDASRPVRCAVESGSGFRTI